MANIPSMTDHFVHKDPSVRALYDHLLKTLKRFGPVEQDPKKTSNHINRTSALVGVETRKDCLLLTFKADHKINNPCIEKFEQISARRFHHKVRIRSSQDFDAELNSWLEAAYALAE
ncbi:MAG TPA: DUF5655 domain-containing protein [Anaerolineales bacterium]|nr:DUF5655 domain-containing protein [Anaerolineales bacterium]